MGHTHGLIHPTQALLQADGTSSRALGVRRELLITSVPRPFPLYYPCPSPHLEGRELREGAGRQHTRGGDTWQAEGEFAHWV